MNIGKFNNKFNTIGDFKINKLRNPIVLNKINNLTFSKDTYIGKSKLHLLVSPKSLFNDSKEDKYIPKKLEIEGRKSFEKYKNQSGACERTAIELHSKILGKNYISVRYLPKANLGENGHSLNYLKDLANSDKLKPGMIIFINTVPEMSLKNLKPSNRHWFTYMGVDKSTGQHVFHDQIGDKQTLDYMIKKFKYASKADVGNLKERKIHTIFDPYKDNRDKFLY